MNPAVLVILWIRLSVTFGYPATLTDIRTISKIFGDTLEYKGISPSQSTGAPKPYDTTRLHPAQYTSPFFTSYPSTLILRRIRESSTPDSKDDTQIISIVRVSSTSMVKPKVIINKSNEISVSVSTSKGQNRSVDKFENLVTPFVSLLRNNRFDVDEDVPKQTFKAARPTDVNYVPTRRNLNSSIKPVLDYSDDSRTPADRLDEVYGKSETTLNATDFGTEQYVDVTEPAGAKKGKHLEPVYEDSYDEQEYAESEHVYGETEKIYGQPEKSYDEPEKSYRRSEKPYGEPDKAYVSLKKVYGELEKIYSEPEKVYGESEKVYGEPEKVYGEPEKIYAEPEKVYSEPEKVYSEPEKIYGEPAKIYGEPAKVYGEPEKVYSEPAKVYGEPAKVYGEPAKVYGEPAKIYGEPAKIYGEPEKVYSEPEKIYGEPEKVYGEPEKIHGQPEKPYPKTEIEEPETELQKHDDEFKMPESSETSKTYSSFTTKINDQKSSYIVDNGTYRKYRVEEKTPDGFIVGEYGMVSHQDGSLRGVRYTADSNINPSLIYETLVKFLSLK